VAADLVAFHHIIHTQCLRSAANSEVINNDRRKHLQPN
jgi:hypothetical protein